VRTERVTDHPHWEATRGITALVCVGDERVIQSLQSELRGALGQAVYAMAFPIRRFEARPDWAIVVRAAGYSKGTALHWLAGHYGVRPEEVVAVGDWFNDVPMFEAAGRSFVMGQAPERVKEAATDRLDADSSTGGGIAEAALRAGLL
jgi:hydroxymethylpyrimidine pyrophosphatase-like HAD family hydrolase